MTLDRRQVRCGWCGAERDGSHALACPQFDAMQNEFKARHDRLARAMPDRRPPPTPDPHPEERHP